jgi:subtilisin-like proprotein convertase family protein
MKPLVSISLLASFSLSAHAASTVSQTFIIGTQVPDNSPIGLSESRHISSSITSISEVNVQIVLSGGWAGDLYAYLTHGSGFTVLLNRPGRSLADVAGSGVSALTASFSDSYSGDIHTTLPASGAVNGFFQPDGREIDPDNSLDTSPRTAMLSSFIGLDASGDWTLYVADVSSGDTMTLASWSLTITGVPEPATATLVAAGALGLLRRRRPTN